MAKKNKKYQTGGKLKTKRFEGKKTRKVTEDKGGIRDEYYSNTRAINPDGTSDYRAVSEIVKNGKHDYSDYYGKVDKSGAHVLPPVEAKAKRLENGGKLEGLLEGPSHAEGGINFEVEGQMQQAEGGEFVIKKDSAKKLGYKNLEKMNDTGVIPTLDARKRRAQNIQSYDVGGKVYKEETNEGFTKQEKEVHDFNKWYKSMGDSFKSKYKKEIEREKNIENMRKFRKEKNNAKSRK